MHPPRRSFCLAALSLLTIGNLIPFSRGADYAAKKPLVPDPPAAYPNVPISSKVTALVRHGVGRDAGINQPRAARKDRVREGLSLTDWFAIRAALEVRRHAIVALEDGYCARNPGQRWLTRFDGHGFLIAPNSGGWSWGLELMSYGLAGHERLAASPSCVEADGPRLSYHRSETLTEWFVNDRRGLEHGYTVHQRPENHAVGPTKLPDFRSLADEAETLCFTLKVRGGLFPEVCRNGRDLRFTNADGAAVVNYGGLLAFDADGVRLPARFESAAKRLRLTVDDRGARYPITIDPIAQQAYLKASNTDGGDEFGYSVAVSEDTAVVGAWLEQSNATGVNRDQSDNSANQAGAAYVFVRDDSGVWSQQAYLKASNTEGNDLFGQEVAVSEDTVVVGALWEDSNATGVNGDQSNNSAQDSGAAYVFVRDASGVWSQQAYLKASNTGASDRFGFRVAVSGDTLVVGAIGEDSGATGVNGNQGDNSLLSSGAAYVFVRDAGGAWSQQAYLKASNTGAADYFGFSVDVQGDTVVVGATQEDSNATGVDGNQFNNSFPSSGAAYVFARDGTNWAQQAYLKASNTDAGDQFGNSTAVSGNLLVVGAYQEDSHATGVNGNQGNHIDGGQSGAAYVFMRNGAAWTQQAYLKASNTGEEDQFGVSVAASIDTVVVGARYEDSSATGVNGDLSSNSAADSGAAYVFVRDPSGFWNQRAYLKASNTGPGDQFGHWVAVSGDTVVVGARFEDSHATGVNGDPSSNSAADSGAAYVFTDVVTNPGDVNCDGAVTYADVGPFLLALFDPVGYAASFPDCPLVNSDLNDDGDLNGADIQPFVALLMGG